jgi:hypothetical protein
MKGLYGLKIALGLGALALAAGWSIRLAVADWEFRQQTPESVERAMALDPRNPEYLQFRALQIEYDGGDSTVLLMRVAALNPLSSAPRIRLGLAAEIRGDIATAERWLLEAARLDRQYEPRWTLANFYFRNGREEEFWRWIRLALEVSYGDRRPAFELCRRMSPDPQEVLARGIPPVEGVVRAYLVDALQRRDKEAVFPVAMKLAAFRRPDDQAMLLGACDFLIDAGEIDRAGFLWTGMGYPPPQGITHPDFETPRSGSGFDWRLIRGTGVSFAPIDGAPGIRVRLSGEQPQSCLLLRQILTGFNRRARYRLEWQSRTSGLRAPAGVRWKLGSDSVPVAPSEDWSQGAAEVSLPPNAAWLELVYERPLGETRAEGSLDLRQVRLTRMGR